MSFEKQQAIWLYSIIMALTAQRGLELGIEDMTGQEWFALAELCAWNLQVNYPKPVQTSPINVFQATQVDMRTQQGHKQALGVRVRNSAQVGWQQGDCYWKEFSLLWGQDCLK